jgi:phage protein U
MAVIGTLGDVVFSVSKSQVSTFDGLKWNSSAKYSAHDRHLKDPLLEFTGNNADTISFSMYFSAFLGMNPIAEIAKLLTAERNGRVSRLVIGSKAYGKNKWVITSLSKDLERFDNKGNLLIAKVNISLQAYSER